MTNDRSCHALLAGAARADITPELGIQLAGDIGRYRPCEEIRDRLYVRALVLESEGRRCCLLSLDLLAATVAWADEVRGRVADRLGIAPEDVIFHVTQNHAAPSLGHCFVSEDCTLMPPEYPWLRGGDDRYNPGCVAACVTAAETAAADLRPVTLALGRGMDGRVACNRRFVMRDGTVKTHPDLCDPNILHTEGPIDPEVGLAVLTDEEGRVVASLLHHTCHPTHGYPHRFIIGDWPGAWSELMAERLGGVALVINGCCGNVHHTNHINPEQTYDPDLYHLMAGRLAETASAVATRLQPSPTAPLAWTRIVLRLPLRTLTPEVLAEAEAYLGRYPTPKFLDAERTQVDWDWVYAVGTLDLAATQASAPCCPYEIQALRLGDMALVTLMGEPFVEGQLRLKLQSPAPHTFVAHFCNGYAGYLPTAEAFERGGYETRTSNGSKWQPEALDQITDEAARMVGKLFA